MNANFPKPSMGVLNLKEGARKFRLSRYAPSEDIGYFVKHFWVVSWDLTGQDPYMQDVVPNPCVNAVIEKNKTAVYGVARTKYSQLLQGNGLVFGIKFKPGGFYPFTGRPVSELTGQSIHFQTVFAADPRSIENIILSQQDEISMVALAEDFIRPHLPARDETIALIESIIGRIIEERNITRVDQLCLSFGINKRKLQRMFDQYVGVSPKWVIQLYRLQNAAEALDQDQQHDTLKLSMDLGYYDQSHFIRDFKAIVGMTPDQYARKGACG
ncbi:DUF6597 domain-containing transcriptional factor [Paenibacillus tarimensis]